jgi:hypothetical protein
MENTVNDNPMWGLQARTVKLNGSSWVKKYQGVCDPYFTRRFEFLIQTGTFDRSDIQDAGTKVLPGEWSEATPPVWTQFAATPEQKANPSTYVRFKDANGENQRVILNGEGGPAVDGAFATIPLGTVEFYSESNFFELGIPVNLEA